MAKKSLKATKASETEVGAFPGCHHCLTEAVRAVLPEELHVTPDGHSVPSLIAQVYADMYAHANLHMAEEGFTET